MKIFPVVIVISVCPFPPNAINQNVELNMDGILFVVDHVLPCVSFNLLIESEIFKCYHYTNLQPLLIADNLLKGAILPDGTSARKTLTKIKYSDIVVV